MASVTCERLRYARTRRTASSAVSAGASLAARARRAARRTARAVKFCGECGAALDAVCGQATARSDRRRPSPSARLVSVLFADLVGFTTASEARDAEDTRELLTRYFDTARTVIERYGGTVEKFIGDAVMAVWGTPVANEDDAERAVRAGARARLRGRRRSTPASRPAPACSPERRPSRSAPTDQGMVAGDLVNTASRIQSTAEPGTVLVGDTTRRASEAAIVYADAGSFELKGKAEPVPLCARRAASWPRAGARGESTGVESPFVGRERELRMVKDLFHAVADERRAHLLSIVGVRRDRASRDSRGSSRSTSTGSPTDAWWHRGPLPRLRRGRRVLGAGRDGAHARAHRRGRAGRRRASRKLAARRAGDRPRPGGACLRRAAASAPARPDRADRARSRGSLLGVAPVRRAHGRRVPGDHGLRGHPLGRRRAARVRRVPARLVAQPPDLRRHAGPSGRHRPASRLGGEPAELHLARARAAPGRRDRRAAARTSCPASPTRRSSGSATAPTASRSTPSRRCACSSTAASSSARTAGTGHRRPRDARRARDAACAHRGAARRPRARRAPAAPGRSRAREDLRPARPGDARRSRRGRAPAGSGDARAQGDARARHRSAIARARPVRVRPGARPAGRLRDALPPRPQGEASRCRAVPLRERRSRSGRDRRGDRRPTASTHTGQSRTIPTPTRSAPRREAGSRARRSARPRSPRPTTRNGPSRAPPSWPTSPLERARLLERARRGCALGGPRGRGRSACLRAAFALCDEAGATHDRARVAAALGIAVWRQGRIEEAIGLMEGAFEVLVSDEPDADVATLAAQLGRLHYFAENATLAAEHIETALEIAEELDLPAVLASALNTKSLLLNRRRYESDALLRQALRDRARPRPRLRGAARLQQPPDRSRRLRPAGRDRADDARGARARAAARLPLLGGAAHVRARRGVPLPRTLGRGGRAGASGCRSSTWPAMRRR